MEKEPMPSANPSNSPRDLATRWDRLKAAGFVMLWLGPLAFIGLFDRSIVGYGKLPNYLGNMSCLFTRELEYWTEYYIQIKLEDDDFWLDVPMSEFSQQKPFGHWTRIHRIVNVSERQPNGEKARARLAEFTANRYAMNHPDHPRVVGVRFIAVRHTINNALAMEGGAWHRKPLNSHPIDSMGILSTHEF